MKGQILGLVVVFLLLAGAVYGFLTLLESEDRVSYGCGQETLVIEEAETGGVTEADLRRLCVEHLQKARLEP